jgi:hypothetical protein
MGIGERELRLSSAGLPALNRSGFKGNSLSSVPAGDKDSSVASGSTGRGMKAMNTRPIEKQRAVSIRGLSVAGHVCIQEILLVPENTQLPMKIVKSRSLHTVSVSRPEFSKTQLKKKTEPLTKTIT